MTLKKDIKSQIAHDFVEFRGKNAHKVRGKEKGEGGGAK